MAYLGDRFLDMLNTIEKYYGADSAVYEDVLKHGVLAENFPSIARQAGIDVTVNQAGNVVDYSVKKTLTPDLSKGWEIANGANSNIQTGTANNVFQIQQVSGTKVVEEAGKKVVKETPITKFTNGVKGTLNKPVRGTVAPAIAAVAAGIRLGKAVDSSIYKIGDAMGLNPPEELNPEAWKTIVSEVPDNLYGSAYKWGFNTLFGLNDDATGGQMYLDENALAYMAQWLNKEGALTPGKTVIAPDDYLKKTYPGYTFDIHTGSGTYFIDGEVVTPTISDSSAEVKLLFCSDDGPVSMAATLIGVSANSFSIATSSNPTLRPATPQTVNDKTFYVSGPYLGYSGRGTYSQPLSYIYDESGKFVQSQLLMAYVALFGLHTTEQAKEGVSDLTGATVPDVSGVTTEAEMLAKLKELFPELWENRVEHEVVQPDGTTKTFTYVPISIPTGGAGLNPDSTGNTQNGTAITGDTATDTQLNTIIQYITKLDSLNKGMQDSDTEVTTPPLNPPATGGGSTPIAPPASGKASALYTIYNPTLEQINSLGAWLWSSNFIDQLLKLFSSPMDAIIGLHKVYATPATGAAQNIKVGYLDSGVPSKVVTEQYTTIDCGTINCYEYFGNVLDYNPYTNLRLYLPFIGIIELSNSDVMRSSINVVYHVDVLTGACLAEVKITRDGGGGTLYQYAGNACTTLPISSGSYMGVISSVSSVATRALAGFASGGALGAVASGATGILNAQGTNVVHSGGFSGNAGAMGCKKPYLIVERPQTETANNTAKLIGYGSNLYTELSACKGFTTVKAVHVDTVTTATENEKDLIEQLLKAGVIIK